ncbi:hypothetical protein ABW21_db0201353 [Orbilia brochopaga]|nr:hypothetical protein ABW21_db0201353 [Drechslerella brochopaga]
MAEASPLRTIITEFLGPPGPSAPLAANQGDQNQAPQIPQAQQVQEAQQAPKIQPAPQTQQTQQAPQASQAQAPQNAQAATTTPAPEASRLGPIDQRRSLDPVGFFAPRVPDVGHHERCRKRIRGSHDGIMLFDTTNARYVFENRYFPTFYIRLNDFFKPGENLKRTVTENEKVNEPVMKFLLDHRLAKVVEFSWWLRIKGELTAQVSYISSGPLDGFLRIPFKAIDTWREEEDQILGYPRDPYKRVDAHTSCRIIEFKIDGTIFTSNQAVVLFQTGFPARFYFTSDILKLKTLASGRKTMHIRPKKNGRKILCPYKGEGEYFDLEIGGKEYKNILWVYNRPNPEVALIKDRYCFNAQHPNITIFKIEGAAQDHPAPADRKMTAEERELFGDDY